MDNLLMAVEETLPPNYSKLDMALRSIGYSFEVAVADIIDNAIDAQAKRVLIRFVIKRDAPLDVVIYDDGSGMDEMTLREAMRFGADVSEQIDRLGKFGLGLKLASLSQARELRVYSLKAGKLSGRGWLEEGITRGFTSSIFDQGECMAGLQQVGLYDEFKKTSTAVFWSRLYRVGQSHSAPEEHVQRLIYRLKDYLGLAFHRFLAGPARIISITIDMFDADSGKTGIPAFLKPLDPFGYGITGHNSFPDKFLVGGYKEHISLIAHIWPPNAKQPEYKLPGGANARQGFYFYRSNRLIQGGGWNGIREADPHFSLARVSVDLSPKFDVQVSLDVKKIEVQLPSPLVKAIQESKTGSGIDFKKYLALAERAYRSKSALPSEIPLALGQGVSKRLQQAVLRELGLKTAKKLRRLNFEWCDFSDDSLFDVDRDAHTIMLNRAYRRSLLHGLNGSSTDAPVTKCLLFLLLRDVFYSERVSSRVREKIDQANRILVAAIKHERS
jgi:hypothetical protein